MTGLDILLSKALEETVKKNLGSKTMQKIEKRIFERFGVGVTQAFNDFHKIDSVLRELFGSGADGLEKKFLEGIITFEKSSNKKHGWATIESDHLNKTILEAFGDEDKKKIMSSVVDTSHTVLEILEICKIPQTSGYRKVNSLINSGLLIPQGFIVSPDGKKIVHYCTLFKNIKIDIQKNNVVIKTQISRDLLEESSIIQVAKVI